MCIALVWAEEQRSHRFLRGLEVATEVWLFKEDGTQAVVASRQLVDADPLRETSHERLIRSHLLAGNRAGALRACAEFEKLLREELGVEPFPHVQRAYEAALATGLSATG